jgi:molybdopterin converting factor small subunit
MALVSLHYWAGARAAAGTSSETVEAGTVREALQLVRDRRADPRYTRVVAASSLLIEGRRAHEVDLDRPLDDAIRVEVLPPFAGGAEVGCGESHADVRLA